MAFSKLHQLIDGLSELPGIRDVRESIYMRRFRQGMPHAFHGVYESYAGAAAKIPANLPPNYNNPAAAKMYEGMLQVTDHDYPALFWIQDALAAGYYRIADLGGSTGIKFHAFKPWISLPANAQWLVIETDAAVAHGRELAAQGTDQRLQFSCDIEDADGSDVLFASGSLQYLPLSIGQVLSRFRHKPRRVVVNTTPIHPTKSFFTLNNIGVACCPYRVTARAQFISEVVEQGYNLLAEWHNPAKSLILPYSHGFGIDHYSGFCFNRIQSSPQPK